jgi:hypothetical protein
LRRCKTLEGAMHTFASEEWCSYSIGSKRDDYARACVYSGHLSIASTATVFRRMVVQYMRQQVTNDAFDAFLRTCAEWVYVRSVLMSTRYTWRPSGITRPQCAMWQRHAEVMRSFARVAETHAQEERQREAEWAIGSQEG